METANFTVSPNEILSLKWPEPYHYISLDCNMMGRKLGFISTNNPEKDTYYYKNIRKYLRKSNLGDELAIEKLTKGLIWSED